MHGFLLWDSNKVWHLHRILSSSTERRLPHRIRDILPRAKVLAPCRMAYLCRAQNAETPEEEIFRPNHNQQLRECHHHILLKCYCRLHSLAKHTLPTSPQVTHSSWKFHFRSVDQKNHHTIPNRWKSQQALSQTTHEPIDRRWYHLPPREG